jgi:hypothetical protein
LQDALFESAQAAADIHKSIHSNGPISDESWSKYRLSSAQAGKLVSRVKDKTIWETTAKARAASDMVANSKPDDDFAALSASVVESLDSVNVTIGERLRSL